MTGGRRPVTRRRVWRFDLERVAADQADAVAVETGELERFAKTGGQPLTTEPERGSISE